MSTMPTTTTTQNQTTDLVTKVKTNWEIFYKSISSYVAIGATGLLAWFMSKNGAEQQALISQFPLLVPYSPYIIGAGYVVARLFPQFFTLNKDKVAAANQAEAEFNQLKTDLATARAMIAEFKLNATKPVADTTLVSRVPAVITTTVAAAAPTPPVVVPSPVPVPDTVAEAMTQLQTVINKVGPAGTLIGDLLKNHPEVTAEDIAAVLQENLAGKSQAAA